MKIKHLTLVAIALLGISYNLPAQAVEVRYFHITLNIEVDKSTVQYKKFQMNENYFELYFNHFSNNQDSGLINKLTETKKKLSLNDWLYTELLYSLSESIFPGEKSNNSRVMLVWCLLIKSGYDVRLRYDKNNIYIYAKTIESLKYLGQFKSENVVYSHLPIHNQKNLNYSKLYTYLYPKKLGVNGRAFSFQLDTIPGALLKDTIIHRHLKFQHNEKNYDYAFSINQGSTKFMNSYPMVDIANIFRIRNFVSIDTSLIAYLREDASSMTQIEAIYFLLTMVRESIKYKEDSLIYKKERWCNIEQSLANDFSDCEDKSAIFFYLCKKLLKINPIVVCFPNHVTVAIPFDNYSTARAIYYNEKKYYICDPSGPGNSLQIGDFPQGLENVPYTIIDPLSCYLK